jgi:hypothetical protein
MTRRILALTAATAVVLALVGAPAVQASGQGIQTEIAVSPGQQVADGCPYATASWTVTLDGGTTGPYSVSVSYGDGYTPPVRQTNLHSIPWSYTFYDPTCSYHYYHQYWTGSRSGGGTAHADTYVTAN